MTHCDKPTSGPAPARRLTVKQERFAHAFVALGSATEAYRVAYDVNSMAQKTVHEAASRLLRNSKVAARIREIRARTAQEYGITRMGLLLELDEAFAIAKAGRKAPAMIAATMAKGRLAGFVDHVPTPAKDRPLALPLGDLLDVHGGVLAAVASGEISTRDGHTFAGLLEGRRRLIETTEFENRLAAIEARLSQNATSHKR